MPLTANSRFASARAPTRPLGSDVRLAARIATSVHIGRNGEGKAERRLMRNSELDTGSRLEKHLAILARPNRQSD